MNVSVVLVLVCLAVTVNSVGFSRPKRATQKYTTRYDNIDVDRILHSRRLLLNYINCLLEKGPCSPEGRELKKIVPDALQNNCTSCTETQKTQAGKVLTFVLLNYRNEWNMLIDKYDADGSYRRQYEIGEDYDYSELDDSKR